MPLYKWLQRREHGFPPCAEEENYVHSTIYKSFEPYTSWNGSETSRQSGGVFNLEFSPEGNLLVAACEKKAVILFDTITSKQIKTINNAHLDNVNCIKFLDNRMFATGSDDTTVALWDTRNLKTKIRSLQGHSNWVKNIEYSEKNSLLVTSGFDGSIFTWDINSYTEQGFIYHKVFHTSGLMRCRISPDGSKLVICTTGGYLIIIYDLDLTTLAKDLCGFRPNIYRLMQLGRQFIPQAAKFDHVFSKSQKRNRVELVSDFPDKNDAEVLCALQIHPRGWCALSRNISYDEGSEWTCVHDIQEHVENKNETNDNDDDGRRKRKLSETDDYSPIHSQRENLSNSTSNFESTSSTAQPVEEDRGTNSGSGRNEIYAPDLWAAEVTVYDRACRSHRGSRNPNTNAYSYVYAISSGVAPPPPPPPQSNRSTTDYDTLSIQDEEQFIRDSTRSVYTSFYQQQIYQNVKRLQYFIEEPNKGKGFIKEPSFSSDGRVICSPYKFGIRLLAFTDDCSDVPDNFYSSKMRSEVLREVTRKNNCHSDIVVSTKFSPRCPLLVTGCLKGEIVWHHPVF